MSRYIDADKLKEHASHYVRTQPHFHYGDWDNMCISGKEVDEIIDTTLKGIMNVEEVDVNGGIFEPSEGSENGD